MPFGLYQLIIIIMSCGFNLATGCLIISGPWAIRFIQNEYFLSFFETSLLTTCSHLGGIISGLTMGPALSKLGRKKVICFIIFLGSFTGTAFYFANSLLSIFACFFFGGYVILMATNTLIIFLIETLSKKNRGKQLVFVYSFMSLERLLGAFLLLMTLSP